MDGCDVVPLSILGSLRGEIHNWRHPHWILRDSVLLRHLSVPASVAERLVEDVCDGTEHPEAAV